MKGVLLAHASETPSSPLKSVAIVQNRVDYLFEYSDEITKVVFDSGKELYVPKVIDEIIRLFGDYIERSV